MGVLYDYFSAADDDEAVSVQGWPAGPGCPPNGVEPKDMIDLKGIDPAVMLGTLEALLTGVPYAELVRHPGNTITLTPWEDGEEQGVVTIADEVTAVLAGASDDRLREVAGPWSRTEEFWWDEDPADAFQSLQQLRDLAVRTVRRKHHLYCWWSL